MKRIIGIILILLMLMPTAFAGDETVTVRIPDFDVRVNGNKVNSNVEQYPFILYKGITYIPMTWDLSNALGLKVKWDATEGLSVDKKDSMTVFSPKHDGSNVMNRNYEATVVSFPVTVNGKVVDNTTAEYPLLNFRYVTYFPMTYDYMVNEFGCGYKWDNDTGFAIDASADLQVNIPEPIVYTQEMTWDEFYDDNQFESDYFTAKVINDDMIYYSIDYNMNEDLDHYMFDLSIRYYDEQGNYQHTKKLFSGAFYEYVEKAGDYLNWSWIDNMVKFSRVEFIFEFRTKNELKALTDQMIKESGIEVELVESKEISKDKLLKDGAVYVKGGNMRNYERFFGDDEKLWTYAALEAEGNTFIEYDERRAGEQYTLSHKSSGDENYRYGYNNPREYAWKVSDYSEIKVDLSEAYSRLHSYIDGNYHTNDSDYVLFLYDENKEIIKIYINEDRMIEWLNR